MQVYSNFLMDQKLIVLNLIVSQYCYVWKSALETLFCTNQPPKSNPTNYAHREKSAIFALRKYVAKIHIKCENNDLSSFWAVNEFNFDL